MSGGQGRFRFLPLGPLATPVTPLKRSLREGVRHCTPSLYCTKRRHRETGDSSRARPVGDAARGESGGIGSIASGSAARRPYSNQRCGCECNEQTKGERLKAAKCREVFPLSLFTIVHRQLPRKRWSLLVRFTSSYIKPALKGEVDASATSRRRGCIGAALIYGNPSVNPPCGVLPAPRPGSLLGAILYAKIYELTPRLEQGRLTHCRS